MLEDRKEKKISFRMSADDLQILQEVAEEHGLSLSKYIRMILDQAVLLILTERVNCNEN